MSSVREIAEQAGVSVATVSRALNCSPEVSETTRRKVMHVAERLGYVATVGRRPTDVIGLVYPADPIKAEYGSFESNLLSGILRGVNEQRFDVKILRIERDRDDEESFTRFFSRKGVRGVIVRTVESTPVLAEQIAREGFPSVVVADRSDDPSVNYVCADSRGTTLEAINHLVHLGHRRIGIGLHVVLDSDHRDRFEGYREALERHGIDFDESLVQRIVGTMEGGAQAVDALLSLDEPPTAIFMTTPLAAGGALHRCLELGIRVPRDLSIAGVDDGEIRRRTFPSLTAVCQDATQIGYEAAQWLTRRIRHGGSGHLRLRLGTQLEINNSTGPCPSTAPRIEAEVEVE
ncbi:MAG: LacI family DNA-binding transcriptional regulator [Phycisphaerales bacterium]|nr:LacI family DNA-binding transcriptional regulator [Phycisphaerales bacterium]